MVNKKNDLTRIEDLTDFDHEEDPETDAILDKAKADLADSNEDDSQNFEDTQNDEDSSFFTEDTGTLEEVTPLLQEDEDEGNEVVSSDSDLNEESSFDFQEEVEEDINNSIEDNEFEEEEPTFNSEATDEDFVVTEENFLEEDPFSFDESNPVDNFEENISFDEVEVEAEAEQKVVKEIKAEVTIEENLDFIQEEKTLDPPNSLPIEKVIPAQVQDLQDINQFANKKVFAKVLTEGSPAFSIKLSNIRFKEDAQDILQILNEHKFITIMNEKIITDGLFSGNTIIGHISEFAAISLYHKFRRFDLTQEMGPAEKLHVSDTYKNDNLSPISKRELFQNLVTEDSPSQLSKELRNKVFCSVSDQIENLSISDYLGTSSVSGFVDSISSGTQTTQNLDEIHESLQNKLMDKAQSKNANGIINLSYSINHVEIDNIQKFQVICSGNIVKFIEK